jgi:hypothetical protein
MAVVRNTDKPTVDLKTEAEVYLVRHALDRLYRRYVKTADELGRRGAVSLEWMMRNHSARIHAVLAIVPEDALTCHLMNKEQVDWAAKACEGLITEYRLGQCVEWDGHVSAMIQVLMPLLDRIRIGWKRPAEIPPEVMEQIKAREGGRFWNPNPGDWLETEGPREDEMDVYAWRSPEFDLVEDFEWIGLKELAHDHSV